MYKNAKTPQALRIELAGRAYRLRHLFSIVESWGPKPEGKAARRVEHQHTLYHAVLYTRGRGEMNLKGRKLRFSPGFFVLTSPGEPHMFGPHEDCGEIVEYRSFNFDLIAEDGAVCRADIKEVLTALWGGSARKLDCSPSFLGGGAFHEALNAMDAAIALKMEPKSFPGPLEAPAALALLGLFFKFASRGHGSGAPSPDERLLKAKSLIELDLKGELDAEGAARKAGISKAHFIRSFKKAFGEAPMKHSRRIRLARARRLILEGRLGVKAIAEECGFCDEFHLSKLFKEEFGESPSDCKRDFARLRQ